MQNWYTKSTDDLCRAILSLKTKEECRAFLEDICTIKEIQDRTGRYVGCLEEIGLNEGWLDAERVHAVGDELSMTLYGQYLLCL